MQGRTLACWWRECGRGPGGGAGGGGATWPSAPAGSRNSVHSRVIGRWLGHSLPGGAVRSPGTDFKC